MKKPIAAFLKFGKFEHLEDLRKGSLFFRPLSYFQDLESDEARRSDPHEGVQGIFQPNRIKLSIGVGSETRELTDLAGPVIVTSKGLSDVHAFCLFALTPGEYEVEDQEYEDGFLKIRLNPSLRSFGGHVLVASAGPFLERVVEALKKNNVSARCNLVEYISESDFHGNIPENKIGFCKLDTFKHQNEYRIITYNSGSPNSPISMCLSISPRPPH